RHPRPSSAHQPTLRPATPTRLARYPPSRPYRAGRVAQWKSTRLTSGGSLVRTQPRPPHLTCVAASHLTGPNPVTATLTLTATGVMPAAPRASAALPLLLLIPRAVAPRRQVADK